MAIRIGTVLDVPKVPGRWSVWSAAGGFGPGAYFLVPADDKARAVSRSHVTAKLTEITGKAAVVKVLA